MNLKLRLLPFAIRLAMFEHHGATFRPFGS